MPSNGLVLELGHVYRTRDLSQWTSNPARLARRLVERAQLRQLAQGLFVHPRQSRFSTVQPADEEVMRAFLMAEQAVADRDDLTTALASALRDRRFAIERLRSMAKEYGFLDKQARVASEMDASHAA
ncbi:MAG: hypothetical protein F4Y92_02165 [Dehalococcoidia bacterium]|nr:hypothetical protein [Dehalococcoidia bacterium]